MTDAEHEARDLEGVGVFFDLDGTLIDTAADLAAAMNHALALRGFAPLDTSDVRHLVGRGARAMLARGFERHGETLDAPAMDDALAAFLEHYRAHIADCSQPFPGAVDVLHTLGAAGARLAICTNKREALARMLLDALDLSRLFDTIVGGDTAAAPKPDAAPVRLCADRLGVSPLGEKSVFIGDSATDIQACLNAGAPCLLATFGYGPTDLAARAFATFDQYDAVPMLVRGALNAL